MCVAEIYIQIPSYRDSELGLTLQDLLSKANNAEKLRICVLWQHAKDEELSPELLLNNNIEIIKIGYKKSKGCNWARSLLQKRWKGEKYTLFLDSHHRFTQGWDTAIIDMYESLKQAGIKKPAITAYLPPYNSKTDPCGRERSLSKIYSLDRIDGLLLRIGSRRLPLWEWLIRPIAANYLSLHFFFTAGTFNEEIMFDPGIYFMGDEVLMSLRAFTHGYDLFHPHKLLGWHEYERITRVPHWDDHSDWQEKNTVSINRLKDNFTGRIKGKYGVGKQRSIADYELLIGEPLVLS